MTTNSIRLRPTAAARSALDTGAPWPVSVARPLAPLRAQIGHGLTPIELAARGYVDEPGHSSDRKYALKFGAHGVAGKTAEIEDFSEYCENLRQLELKSGAIKTYRDKSAPLTNCRKPVGTVDLPAPSGRI